ncbi:MAG: sporulation protein YqfD [Lachnospiraceae bacterium]|nr:sporulation protein YqfD [Lachnospiraceae bacterium]
MEQRFVHFLHGYVRIRIMGASCDRFLNLCAFHGIFLWRLLPADGAYEACVSRTDFLKLKEIVKKSHTRIRIIKRYGLPFFIHKYRKRWACAGGALAACLFMAWLSSHIWNISIEGNLSQTDDVIFEYLGNEGVSHGMWKNQVDTLTLSDQIRNYFPSFSWVSTELKGTRLVIYVKEGISDAATGEGASDIQEGLAATGLAASKPGTVVSVYVRKGLSAVSAGDVVEAGELLVSGRIPVYNDDGEVISFQEVTADADIVLRTETAYHDEVPCETVLKSYTGREKNRYLIRICGSSFSLPGGWGAFELCDVTGVISQLKLSENFYIPAYFYKYTAREYENLQYYRTKDEVQAILESNLSIFVQNLEEKGVQIFQNNVTIDLYENTAVADGVLITDESAVIYTAENTDSSLSD